MSGGRWGHIHYQMRRAIDEVATDPKIETRFPDLAMRLRVLAEMLFEVINDLDYDLCGDRAITDDADFQKQMIARLRAVLA